MNNQFASILAQLIDASAQTLQLPIDALLDPSKRIYIVFIVSSLLFSAYALAKQKQLSRKQDKALRYDAKGYFSHRSHLSDIALWLANGFIKLAIITPLFLSQLGAAIVVYKLLLSVFGDAPKFAASGAIVVTAFTIAYFIVDDLTRFLLHWALHRFAFLWHFHKVHHSAEVLSPLTVYRLHPFEMLLYSIRHLISVGLVAGGFSWLFTGHISAWMILGVNAAGFSFNFFAANLRHSHIWLGFGVFEKLFISPAQHQIHHSTQSQHRDKNFGSCLALWDKLAGSLVYSKSVKTDVTKITQLTFGLTEPSLRQRAPEQDSSKA